MRHFILVILLCGTGLAAPLLWLQHDEDGYPANAPEVSDNPNPGPENRPLIIRSFSFTSFSEHGIDNMLAADELEIRPRHFLAFNIRSINEAVANNAHLSIYTREGMDTAPQFFGFQDAIPLPGDKENRTGRGGALGLITRMVLNGMEMDLFRDEQHIMTLAAPSGLVEKKNGALKAFNATLTDIRSSRRLKTRKLLWDSKRKVFQIPGYYTVSTSSGPVSGRSAEVDLDFVFSPLKN